MVESNDMKKQQLNHGTIQNVEAVKMLCKQSENDCSPDMEMINILSKEEGKTDNKQEDRDERSNFKLAYALRPMYHSMKIFGLIWRRHTEMVREGKVTFTPDCHTIHCILLLLLVWINALSFFFGYSGSDTYGNKLFKKITGNLYSVQTACGITSYIYFIHIHIPHILYRWERYKKKYIGISIGAVKRHVFRRVVLLNVAIVILYFLFNLAYFFADEPDFYLDFVSVIVKKLPDAIWIRILMDFLYFYINMAWLQSIIFATCVCFLLSCEFNALTDDMNEIVKDKGIMGRKHSTSHESFFTSNEASQKSYSIEQYRQRHLELCLLVNRFNNILYIYLFFFYTFSVPMIVLMLYGVTTMDEDSYQRGRASFLTGIMGLVLFVFVLTWVTLAGTSLAAAVCMTVISITSSFNPI